MWKIEDAIDLYGIERWGNGYFSFNKNGDLSVRPTKKEAHAIDLKVVVDSLVTRKIKFPILFRFPQILEAQIKELNGSFSNSISEYKYNNTYQGAFPMKVNQRKEVIEEIVKSGKKYNLGLEVGTKAELLAALSFELGPEALLICNGFKDDEYLKLALNAVKLKNRVVIVIDEYSETKRLLELSKLMRVKPLIGIRVKLYSKGSGKWAESGGESAKFGLTTTEMLDCIKTFAEYDMFEQLQMLHFHVGSQITEIRRIQKAVKEAARVYAKIRNMHINIKYFNIGGGLGVDYDGSKTSSDASANYTMQEYANNVVYSLKDVCDEEGVPHPIILSESGRAISSYHSLLVINIKGNKNGSRNKSIELIGDEPHIVKELYDGLKEINIKNYIEYYHDALQHREELLSLFNLGEIELEEKSKGEILFMMICEKAAAFARETENKSDDFDDLNKLLSKKYIGNFSTFQSIPDFWAIKQLFPVVPVSRANEKPTQYGTIVDITCDSDGEIDKFVDLKDVKEILELHELNNGSYYLAILMLGAYQDTIGDYHNLFGAANEAHIIVDDSGEWHLKQIVNGDRNCDVLGYVKYNTNSLLSVFESEVVQAQRENKLSKQDAEEILNNYKDSMNQYTYLDM
ncbi:MAG: biosynthetic arginine decarboxylase [Euryarchaeota archaeon]|nr:biosynthetic arginine decarboxylase [Euryarchaeota archaeon]MBU4223212.1 biosynthetic arginine decarboxylase [Euryarchaeota archaeon]MBU4340296.1 biosynthetic arginine decarboxylase [Euryarchaeota archaeon]MBU4454392.1 biosynthetic arginine decarboxylase [Euryarchaeota archaeon]MCG2734768.1 biosynthetic arginine decarboxylase [Candidatus Methanoperedenaceae archaeon]